MTESPQDQDAQRVGGGRRRCQPNRSLALVPPAPGTVCTDPVEARCVVPTTVEGSATAGKVANTITAAVTTPATGAHRRTPPELRQPDRPLDQVVARRRHGQRDRDPKEVQGQRR